MGKRWMERWTEKHQLINNRQILIYFLRLFPKQKIKLHRNPLGSTRNFLLHVITAPTALGQSKLLLRVMADREKHKKPVQE